MQGSVWRDAAPTNLSASAVENIDRVLHAVRSYLGMDVAFLSEFLGTNRIFRSVDSARPNAPMRAGGVIPMAAGYCRHVVEGRLPELIPNTSTVALARSIPETRSIPIGAHLSVPVQLDNGQTFGTFCCFSYTPRPALEKRDLELLRTFSRLIAAQIGLELDASNDRRAKADLVRNAVRQGDPQIVFQPIFDLSTREITAVEALSRFSSTPARSPDLWFADAEEIGLGAALELLAVRRAITRAKSLPAEIAVNLNISPRTIVAGEVADSLAGIDPSRVVIEVTEHEPIVDYEALIVALQPLRAAGVRVAIDDAGAGYSSLRHVLMLKPEIIKLDISLTRGIDRDETRRSMAAALSEFARHSGTRIIAEGIENEAELMVLRALGIGYGQGYYLGRPEVDPLAETGDLPDGASAVA